LLKILKKKHNDFYNEDYKREREYLFKEGEMALIIFTMDINKNKILSKKR